MSDFESLSNNSNFTGWESVAAMAGQFGGGVTAAEAVPGAESGEMPENAEVSDVAGAPEVAEAEKNAEDLAAAESARRQRKLIGVILTGNESFWNDHDIVTTDAHREQVKEKIRDGEMTLEKWSEVIGGIQRPVDARPVPEVAARIERDPMELSMLDYVNGQGEVPSVEVMKIAAYYPTAVDFEKVSDVTLGTLKEMAGSEEEFAAQAAALEKMKKHIYGAQQNYWNEAKNLIAEAKAEEVAAPKEALPVDDPNNPFKMVELHFR